MSHADDRTGPTELQMQEVRARVVAPQGGGAEAVPEQGVPVAVLGPAEDHASQGAEGVAVDWIKVPVRVRDDPRLAELASKLGVTFRDAVGLYVTALAYCGDHETTLLPASVTGPEKEAMRQCGLLGEEGLADYDEAVRSLAESRERARDKKRKQRCNVKKTKSRVPGTSRPSPSLLSLDPDSAVDLVVDSDSKALDSKTNALEVAAPKPKAWTSEAGDDWTLEYKGTSPSYSRIGLALGPLVAARGWAEVRNGWRRYLRATEGRYASPERFSQTYGEWFGGEATKQRITDPVARSIEEGLRREDPNGEGMRKMMEHFRRNRGPDL